MRIAKVWIEHPVLKLDQVYSYDALDLPAQRGRRVAIDFNGRQRIGFVDSVEENGLSLQETERQLGYALKPLLRVIDDQPLMTPELFALAKWMAKETLSPVISCFQAMLPSRLKPRSGREKLKMERVVFYCGESETLTPRQKEVLQWLKNHDGVLLKLWRQQSPSITRYLEKEGYARIQQRPVRASLKEPGRQDDFLPLTEAQQQAMRQIQQSTQPVVLLHGVTGSGKTEIYLHLAQQVLNQGRQVLILVPEIALTPQMVARVKGRFGSRVAIYHSGLNDQEKYEQYEQVFQRQAEVVVGTRSAVFMPFEDLGLIVVDEEHEPSYKQESLPRYHCRDIAIQRAQSFGCRVILGSATPSLESYARALKGVYGLAELKERVNRQLPVCTIVDMKKQGRSRSGILSEMLCEKIEDRLRQGQQVILLLNRRGYSPVVRCTQCSHTIQCPHCDIAMSYHKSIRRMKCHLCGAEMPVVTVCPQCGSRTFAASGYGTQKLQEEVERLFPEARVLRMDADTTSRKNAHQQLLQQFAERQAQILVGTQMIAKGLDFPMVTLVGILNADAGTARPDFRSVEMTFDLIMQAAGRSGRSRQPGEVIIQAFDADHYAVRAGARQDYLGFFAQEMRYRHLGGYPPYSYLISLVFSDRQLTRAMQAARQLAEELKQQDSFKVLGPTEMARLQDRYRVRLVMKGKDLKKMKTALAAQLPLFRCGSCLLAVDVNPLMLD